MTALERIRTNKGGVRLTGLERREVAARDEAQLAEIERLKKEVQVLAEERNQAQFALKKTAENPEPEPTQIRCLLCGEWHEPNVTDNWTGKAEGDYDEKHGRSLACPNWAATPLREDGRFDSGFGEGYSWDSFGAPRGTWNERTGGEKRQPSKARGCDGKANLGENYREQAEKFAERHGKIYGVYRCPHCEGTHMTTRLEKREDYTPLLYVTGMDPVGCLGDDPLTEEEQALIDASWQNFFDGQMLTDCPNGCPSEVASGKGGE